VARFARVVAPRIPYHVIHRGNRRHGIFFSLPKRLPSGRGPGGYRFHSCKCELEARIGRSLVAGELCDGSEDLAAGFADGTLYAFYNESANVAGLHVRLAKGAIGPVTVSAWQGKTPPVCLGTNLVGGHSPESFFGLRRPGECTLRWSEPGRPNLSRTVAPNETTRTVLLKEP